MSRSRQIVGDDAAGSGSGGRLAGFGFGGAGIGNLFRAIADEEAAAAVAAAWGEGVRRFDTAPHYGLGLSERRLGAALRDKPRATYRVSTKVGRVLEPVADADVSGAGLGDDLAEGGFAVPRSHRRVWDFSADGVRRSLEASLERLGLDRVDVVYLHDPDDHEEQAIGEAWPALAALRDQGVIGAIGVGMNQVRIPLRFVRETDIDEVLLAGRYTLLDREGEALLDAADERDTRIVVGGVFNSGLLVDPQPDATFDYAAVKPEVLAKALRIKEICARYDVPIRAAALAFPARHPAVSGVLIGARSVAEVVDCAEMAALPIPDALWGDLREAGF